MLNIRQYLLLFLFLLTGTAAAEDFVSIREGHFVAPESPAAPFVINGANIDSRLIKEVRGRRNNRKALKQELEALHKAGINVIRIQAGPDTVSYNATSATCQSLPDDTLLTDIDFLLHEAGKVGQHVVICLTDAWVADSTISGDLPSAVSLSEYIKRIALRVNTESHKAYKDDPVILSWEILNEPQSLSPETYKWFSSIVGTAVTEVKANDTKHLVALGCRLNKAKRSDITRFERLNIMSGMDYFATQIHPILDKWSSFSGLYTSLPNVYVKTGNYLTECERIAAKYNRPLVVSGFSYPRDRHYLSPGTSSVARNSFFKFLANRLRQNRQAGGSLSGLVFWHWDGITSSPLQENLNDYFNQGDTYGVYDVDAETLQSLTEE